MFGSVCAFADADSTIANDARKRLFMELVRCWVIRFDDHVVLILRVGIIVLSDSRDPG